MKKVIFFSKIWMSVIMLLGFTTTGIAADVKISNIPAEQKITVSLQNLKEDHTLRLLDKSGIVFMRENTGDNPSYTKLLNLKNLKLGQYFIVVESSLRKQVFPFTLTAQGAIIKDYQAKTYFKPVIRINKDLLDVSMFNGKISDVGITFYSKEGYEFFTESLENVLTVERRYELKNFPKGNYRIKVSTPDNTYYESFDVK